MDFISFQNPYQLERSAKQAFLLEELIRLTAFHQENCEAYHNILKNVPFERQFQSLENIPYLPVQLFKMMDLFSIPLDEVIKVLTSSGTTSQNVSKIFIDRDTSVLQTKTLISIVNSFIGKKRLPMIIVDSKEVIKNRKSFSARGAGIVGFSSFGRKHFYLLDENMKIDLEGLHKFLETHKGERILLFGFTFMVWQYFYKACVEKGVSFDLGDSVLIHGGGWKKLNEEAISNEQFKLVLKERFGISSVHNYYGMVEQVGSIFMECEYGHLHAPDYADIIIRDVDSLQPLPFRKKGLIQVLSVLPKSYPGHSLLTEDLGIILGEDDCACGRKGKYVAIEGRLPKAELRGCSDTHAFDQKAVMR